MAAPTEEVLWTGQKPCIIDKVKVKNGSHISVGSLLVTCKTWDEVGSSETSKPSKISRVKSSLVGTVSCLYVKVGETVDPGGLVMTVTPCNHPTVMKDMCADCGADLRVAQGRPGERTQHASASVAMVHNIPELHVSKEVALELAQQDVKSLLRNRKLVLIVDLDQTIIHTTMKNVPKSLPGVHHFQLAGSGRQYPWYHTKLRPGCKELLEKLAEKFQLHIFTMGSRPYAHTVARILDPDKKLFADRILSRDECFDQNSKTANLSSIFPTGDHMVCIIDDREDVWNFAPNLIHVKPYQYFIDTEDINMPPGVVPPDNPLTVIAKAMEEGDNLRKTQDADAVPVPEQMDPKDTMMIDDGKNDPGSGDGIGLNIEGDNNNTTTKLGVDDASVNDNDKHDTSIKGDNDKHDTSITGNDDNKAIKDSEKETAGKVDAGQVLVGADKNVDTDGNISKEIAQSKKRRKLDHNAENEEKKEKEVDGAKDAVDDTKDMVKDGASQETDVTSSANDAEIKESGKVSENTSGDNQGDAVKNRTSTEPLEDTEKGREDADITRTLNSGDCLSTDQSKAEGDKTVSTSEETVQKVQEVELNKVDQVVEEQTTLSGEEMAKRTDGRVEGESNDKTQTADRNDKSDQKNSAQTATDATEEMGPDLTSPKKEEDCTDDYLLYLEDILFRVHEKFFKVFDHFVVKKRDAVPDVKVIIPSIRKKVLAGVRITFSSVFPRNLPPERYRLWNVAISLGAQVSKEYVPNDTRENKDLWTTHVVAAKTGTSKVNTAKKSRKVHVVTPLWLVACWERWERVDERLYLLTKASGLQVASSSGRSTPASENEQFPVVKSGVIPKKQVTLPEKAKSKGDGSDVKEEDTPDPEQLPLSMSDDYNPLYSFSSQDIKAMDKEVEDIFGESSSSDGSDSGEAEEETSIHSPSAQSLGSITQELPSSSDESLTAESPRGWKRKREESSSESGDGGDEEKEEGGSQQPSDDNWLSDEDEMADAIDDLLSYSTTARSVSTHLSMPKL